MKTATILKQAIFSAVVFTAMMYSIVIFCNKTQIRSPGGYQQSSVTNENGK